MSYYVRLMKTEDISRVSEIDREIFPTIKMSTNFENELKNCIAHYIVVYDDKNINTEIKEDVNDSQIIGYAGLWIMVGEAHIVNIAIMQDYRQKGIGELLLISLLEMAAYENCNTITLEVRASNDIAQNLYRKYGFTVRGIRKGYYTDNREDAVIMNLDYINTDEFDNTLKLFKREHNTKWGEFQFNLSTNYR